MKGENIMILILLSILTIAGVMDVICLNNYGCRMGLDNLPDQTIDFTKDYTKEELIVKYGVTDKYQTNHTIEYVNGMEEYVMGEHNKAYPNEMGLCLEANITEDKIIIYNSTGVEDVNMTPNKVGRICKTITKNTILVHSHPDIRRVWNICSPHKKDVFKNITYNNITVKMGIVYCDNFGEIVDVKTYMYAGDSK